jgi:hypothetical protein
MRCVTSTTMASLNDGEHQCSPVPYKSYQETLSFCTGCPPSAAVRNERQTRLGTRLESAMQSRWLMGQNQIGNLSQHSILGYHRNFFPTCFQHGISNPCADPGDAPKLPCCLLSKPPRASSGSCYLRTLHPGRKNIPSSVPLSERDKYTLSAGTAMQAAQMRHVVVQSRC